MQVAADVAMHAARFTFEDIKIIEARLMAGAVSAARLAGVICTTQTGLAETIPSACGADFLPSPPR